MRNNEDITIKQNHLTSCWNYPGIDAILMNIHQQKNASSTSINMVSRIIAHRNIFVVSDIDKCSNHHGNRLIVDIIKDKEEGDAHVTPD